MRGTGARARASLRVSPRPAPPLGAHKPLAPAVSAAGLPIGRPAASPLLSAGALCYAAPRWVGDVGLVYGFFGRVGFIAPCGVVGSFPLALARLVSFAGCVLRPCGGAALRFSPRLGGRSGACSLPPKRLLG